MDRNDQAIIAAEQQAILDAQDRIRIDKLLTLPRFYFELGYSATDGAFLSKESGRYTVGVWDSRIAAYRKVTVDDVREALDIFLDEDLTAIRDITEENEPPSRDPDPDHIYEDEREREAEGRA